MFFFSLSIQLSVITNITNVCYVLKVKRIISSISDHMFAAVTFNYCEYHYCKKHVR